VAPVKYAASVLRFRRVAEPHVVRLEVQGTLSHRNVAMRTISAACRLAFKDGNGRRFQEFRNHVVSALSEAFNNVAIHGYGGREPGVVQIEVTVTAETLQIELRDYGRSFDLASVPPPRLEEMPESGLGIFIIKSFMDAVEYTPGCPNVLKLVKRVS
jgi:serine/threonine-protein kinase RsbW